MVQYYTLEQAAQVLRVTPEKLREMAKQNEVRAFQDRGSLRFRAQEIDEMARARGFGSDSDMALPSEAPKSPRPANKKPGNSKLADKAAPNLSLDDDSDEVPIGLEPSAGKSTSKSHAGTRKPSSLGPKSSPSKSPPPKPASDSDVRLVMEGSDLDFNVDIDSDAKIGKGPGSGPKSGGRSSSRSKVGKPDSNPKAPRDQPSDSDVKMVPTGPDEAGGGSRVKSPSDSDIRIEEVSSPSKSGGRKIDIVTEEIDLDAEEAAAKKTPAPPTRPRPGASPPLPTSSPFELSEHDLTLTPPKSKTPPPAKPQESDSSDFELSLEDSSSHFDLGSDEVPVVPSSSDDDVSLGELTGASGASGINLKDPADSGISLEQGGSDELEFELSLDSGTTPKPALKPQDDSSSSSEFELSLDQDEASPTAGEQSSDSEFELNLDLEGSDDLVVEAPQAESDSEFELTLDDSGGLAVEEEQPGASDEGEVFETEFEVPAIEEESGSEAVALDEADTDLESSDFDLQLEEGSSEEESGSQAVALEEGEEEPAAEEEEPFAADLEAEAEAELEEEEEEEPVATAAAPAAVPWGPLPAIFLLPTVLVLFVVGLMSFELIHGMWGYHKPGKVSNLIIDPIARMIDEHLPKD